MREVVKLYATFLLLAFALLSLSRIGLVLYEWDRVAASGGLAFILVQGLRFDGVLLGMLVVGPGVLAPWALAIPATHRQTLAVLRWVLTAMLLWLLFMEIVTPAFLTEFDARPNRLFFSYSLLSRELTATLWRAHLPLLLITAAALPTGGALVLRRWLPRRQLGEPIRLREAAALSVVFAVVCPLAIRSTLGHRPVNPSTVAFSPDVMVNGLPLPSAYTFLYALYESRLDAEGGGRYGELDAEDVIDEVRTASGIDPLAFQNPSIPTLHRHVPTRRWERPLNLVIVLEESLGAEFVGSMNGIPVTPELDALAEQGMWFENLYATGTRSVRGIEAVVAGFLPTQAPSVVKLPRSQSGFFTLAELLRRQGYHTSFLYGGESHFDNMKRFFLGNGFQEVVDQDDYDDPTFVGSWGVSDEDLFARADREFGAMDGRPFFSLVFTSSNHSPFDFPDGRIELHSEPRASVENAVKYADWALGSFIRRARRSAYWQNTVFLVVADHNSRVWGASLVPIEHFHVPAVFLGGTVPSEKVQTLASQIDLLPTALSLIGIEAETPTLGRDLTRPEQRRRTGRAILQYHSDQAYMEGDEVAILDPSGEIRQYRWDGSALEPLELDPRLRRTALAHALWAQDAYRTGSYRLPPE